MTHSLSITRRLTITVLIIEFSAAIALLGTITVHEHRTQLKSFDAYLRGNAQAILGAVQEDRNDKLVLELRGLRIPREAVYSVQDEQGKLLGQQGAVPAIETFGSTDLFYLKLSGRDYRFLILRGIRYIDPEEGGRGGELHSVTVLYGAPVGNVWHEVFEADRFVALATPLFLGGTALLIVWLMRRGLSPVYELAQQAEKLNSESMHFYAPESAKRTIELRPLTTALETAMLRLQGAFELQERFTRDAAHELKTNVAIVKSSLQLLRLRKRTADEYDAGLARCLDDLGRMETSVQKMLTLARLEQATEPASNATPPSCSLKDAAEEAMLELTPLAELKRVEIVASYGRDPVIELDREDARLLCLNVLLNALQHSPEGEPVILKLDFDGEAALLTIEDHGEGISDIDLPHIFEPFYRADPSRSRKSGGTGLGLSICKAICTRLNGKISIANGPSGGARVMIAIPARPIP